MGRPVSALGAAILGDRPNLWRAVADIVHARYQLGPRACRRKGSARQPWAVARDLIVSALTDAEAADLDTLRADIEADPSGYATARYQGDDGRAIALRLDLCLRRRWRGSAA